MTAYAMSAAEKEAHVRRAWQFYREHLGSPQYVVAPMVQQSELPFRLLCRQHGAHLCYTPMIDAGRYVGASAERRREMFATCAGDRPLVAQLCCSARNIEDFLTAATLLQDHVDAVDLNLGCPQERACKDGFGAFMCDSPEQIFELLRRARGVLKVPFFCKIRILPAGPEATIEFAQKLEAAGCWCVCVHGRTREQTSHDRHTADWDIVRRVHERVGIPVIANGGVGSLRDASEVMKLTGAAGAMSATALLRNPALFRSPCAEYSGPPGMLRLATEYLQRCMEQPGDVTVKAIESHMKEMLLLPLLRLQYVHCPLVLPDPLASLAADTPKGHRLGVVKFYNPHRGFGVLRVTLAAGDQELDVPVDAIFRQGELLSTEALAPGDRVCFVLHSEPRRKKVKKKRDTRGPEARRVRRMVRSVRGLPEAMYEHLFVVAVLLAQGFNGADATKMEVRSAAETACAHLATLRRKGTLAVPDLRTDPHGAVRALLACYRGSGGSERKGLVPGGQLRSNVRVASSWHLEKLDGCGRWMFTVLGLCCMLMLLMLVSRACLHEERAEVWWVTKALGLGSITVQLS